METDNSIGGRLYKLSTESVQGVRDAHEGGVRALAALSEDLIVTGSDDKMVTVWRRMPGTAQFACRHICAEHQKSLRAILAIPAGTFSCIPGGGFATGDLDKVVRVYGVDFSSGQVIGDSPVRTLMGHAAGVISLSLSARGELLSGGWDGQVRVWDVDSGKCLQTLEGHENGTCVLATLLLALPVARMNSTSLLISRSESGHPALQRTVEEYLKKPDRSQCMSSRESSKITPWAFATWLNFQTALALCLVQTMAQLALANSMDPHYQEAHQSPILLHPQMKGIRYSVSLCMYRRQD